MRKQETPNEYFLRCLNEAKSVFAGTKKSSNCDLGAVVHAIFNRVCNDRPWGIDNQYSCSTVGGKINAEGMQVCKLERGKGVSIYGERAWMVAYVSENLNGDGYFVYLWVKTKYCGSYLAGTIKTSRTDDNARADMQRYAELIINAYNAC